MKALIRRITVIGSVLWMSSGAALLGQESETPTSTAGGGLSAQTAIFVIVLLVIVLGGLVIYEMVVRSRAR